ncbi:restriction endonuclease subunit R, partial [Klebsiella pneumoniae]
TLNKTKGCLIANFATVPFFLCPCPGLLAFVRIHEIAWFLSI